MPTNVLPSPSNVPPSPSNVQLLKQLTKKERSQAKIVSAAIGPLMCPPAAPSVSSMNSPQKGTSTSYNIYVYIKLIISIIKLYFKIKELLRAKAIVERAKAGGEKAIMFERAMIAPSFMEFDEETRAMIKRKYRDLLVAD